MTSRGVRIGMAAALVGAGLAGFLLLQGGKPAMEPDISVRTGDPTHPASVHDPLPGSEPPAPVEHSDPGAKDAPPAAKGVLLVTVAGMPSGAPVAGAEVEVRVGAEEPVLARATTGADGRARFEGLAVDRVEAMARAPGRVREAVSVSDLLKPGEHSITIDMEPGVELAGVVLEAASRRPVAGAKVIAKEGGSIGHMSSYSSRPPLMETRSDGDGRFRVDGIPRKEIVTLSAGAAGFVTARHSLMLGEGAEDHPAVELLLEESVVASGLVADPEGRVVPGAMVEAVKFEPAEGGSEPEFAALDIGGGPWGSEFRKVASAKAGEDGRYVLDGLKGGVAYRFFAHSPGFARSPISDPPQSAPAGKPILRDLRLRPEGVLRVRVVGADGAALEGAEACIVVDESGELSPAEEGGSTFRFDQLPAGEYEITGKCRGFTAGKETFPLLEGESRSVNLALARAPEPPPAAPAAPAPEVKRGTVRLRLIVPQGTQAPARVAVAVEDIANRNGSGSTKNWNEGRLEVGDIPPASARLVVSVEGFAPVVRELDLAAGETRDLGDITLDLGCELSGRVEDAAGKPLAGARVWVDLPGFMDAAVGTTNAEGRYRVTRIPPGDRYVRVAAEGLLDHHETLALGSGITTCVFNLVPGVMVRGTVTDAGGRPVKEGRVVLLRQATSVHGIPQREIEYLGSDGTFETSVAAGDYVAEVQDKEGRVLSSTAASFDGKGDARVDLVVR